MCDNDHTNDVNVNYGKTAKLCSVFVSFYKRRCVSWRIFVMCEICVCICFVNELH